MDVLWLVPPLLAAVVGVAVFRWLRKRRFERIRAEVARARPALAEMEAELEPLLASNEYIPERIRRPLDARLLHLREETAAHMEKLAGRTRGGSESDAPDALLQRADERRHALATHNETYVRDMTSTHAKLLVDELKTDQAQRQAIVRDDERNLVIAGAGSGKTRTIVARVRYLLERKIPPSAILAVTFTNKAMEEMQDRLKAMGVPLAGRGTDGVTVSTLHALGKRVVQASMKEPISVADDHWTDSLVAAALRDARESRDPDLTRLYLGALLHFHRDEDERAPSVGGDKTYRTLRGEHVRSIGERIIADFLFLHHVEYEYEAKASWAVVSGGHGAYHPDFRIVQKDANIEYWGVNRAGQVAPWMEITSAMYQQGMAWKRDEFRRAGKILLEFYDYERTEGTLEAALEERLTRAGVPLRLMTLADVETAKGDMKYIGSSVERLLVQFLTNARALRRTPDEIRAQLARATPRVYHFGLLGAAVLERYESRLAAEGRIDFSDMLHRAADVLAGGTNPLPRFRHILVDEFQDTSAGMARFLQALLDVTGARLFAVGDDWQAIFGFAGGDLDYIVRFEEHFGPASTTMLTTNYRSPAVIVEAGAALIARNEKQIPKQVTIFRRERGEAFVHDVPDDDFAVVGRTVALAREELARCAPEEILVLSRTNHALEDVEEAFRQNGIPVGNPERNQRGVRVLSAHRAKGLEANVVLVMNASDHLFGFPSKVENPDVLGPVRMSAGNDKAEERRLFYVAITRAIQRLHIISRHGLPSPYLAEIEGEASAAPSQDPSRVRVGDRFGGTFFVERLYELTERQTAVGIRQAGLLTTSTGRLAFTSWSPVLMAEGGAYALQGVVKERPYRDQPRVKLGPDTKVMRQSAPRSTDRAQGRRDLIPRPPATHRPRLPP